MSLRNSCDRDNLDNEVSKLIQEIEILKNDMALLKDTTVSKEYLQQVIKDKLDAAAAKGSNTSQEKNVMGNVLNGETMDALDGNDLEAAPKDSNRPQKTSSVQSLHTSVRNAVIGVTIDTLDDNALEQDFFSMMMLSELLSRAWLIGLISFGIQMTLGFLVIEEQVDTTSFGTSISIPFRFSPTHSLAQAIVILLAVMTQTDLLVGTRTILLLPMKKSWRWMNVIGENGQPSNALWMRRVFLPNLLKIVQGALILVATLFVILQSQNTVNLLKDYSALFVISSIDDLFFSVAAMGYFDTKLSLQADKVNNTKIEGRNIVNKSSRIIVMGTVISSMFGFFLYVTIGQAKGKYIQQTYPLCPVHKLHILDASTGVPTFYQNIIGDGVCQYQIGEGTNTVECGWDGEDCLEMNERYPDCKNVETTRLGDASRLGDGICHGGFYMSESCGYDNGDCIDFRDKIDKYPFCNAPEPNRWGDGNCDSGFLNSASCGFDDGDCTESNKVFLEKYPNCTISNIGFITDGICSSRDAFSLECGFDGGACGDCNIDDLDLVNSGFCDPPKMQLVGEEFEGHLNWYSFALGNDGNLYGTPFNAKKVLKFDPITKSTTLVGESVDGLWGQGLVGKDGCIYGVPYLANSILKFDPNTGITTLIAEGHPLLNSGITAFTGGTVTDDGIMYFIPFQSKKVVRFNPLNLENPLTEIGEDLGDGHAKYRRGVLASDGNIYCIPLNAKKVLKITVSDDTTSFIGEEYSSEHKWMHGILAPDENIYAVPSGGDRILQINTKNQTTSLIGPDLGSDIEFKWSGFVDGSDGYFYGMPLYSPTLLRFDPVNKTVVMIPLDDDVFDLDIPLKWMHGVRANNGNIYAIPLRQKRILEISL